MEELTRQEYDADIKRIEAEDHRQNTRIDRLEGQFEKLNDLVVSVREIAIATQNMQAELTRQGERLEKIEQEPADNWKKAVWLVVAAAIGFAVHALFGI